MTGLSWGPGPPILRGHPQNFVFMITLPFPPVASHKYDLVYLAPKLSRKFFSIPRERQVYPWTIGEEGADLHHYPYTPWKERSRRAYPRTSARPEPLETNLPGKNVPTTGANRYISKEVRPKVHAQATPAITKHPTDRKHERYDNKGL